MAVKSFRELITWQKAMGLAEMIYEATRGGLVYLSSRATQII